MNNYVEGKVILITGAASHRGFGRAAALKLAKMGAKLVLVDRLEDRLHETTALVKEAGAEAVDLVADVGSYEANKKMVQLALDTFGKLDVFVANAGTMPLAFWSDAEIAMDAWNDCIDTNYKGVMYGIAASREALAADHNGQFIVISSIYANAPVSGAAIYQSTKIAVRYLVNTLRQEEFGKIKTTIINPTGVPGTNLMKTVVNRNTYGGGQGSNVVEFFKRAKDLKEGNGIEGANDPSSPNCVNITANEIADGIVYAINQPAGVSISDLTIRAANETFTI